MSRRARILTLVAAVLMVLAIGLLPFTLMLLPNPRPVQVPRPGYAGVGFYVHDARGTFKLFPHPREERDFPQDAYAVTSSAALFVKSRQYSALTAYGLYALPSRRAVAVRKEFVGGLLRMTPKTALPTGHYVVESSRDGAWEGTDYYYLTVTSGGR